MGGLDLHLSIVMLCLAAGTSCLEVPCAALQEVRPGWSWLAALAGDHGGSSSMDPRWRRGRRIGTGTMAFASPPVLGSHGGGLQLGALKVPRQAPAGGYLHRRGMEGMAKHWHSRAYQGPRPTAMCEQGEGGDGRKKKGDDADEDEDTFVDKLFKPLVRYAVGLRHAGLPCLFFTEPWLLTRKGRWKRTN